jgi:predicted nucleotidyltransferase component of viral defense system
MNHGFRAVLAAPSADRRDLFVTAGNRLGTVEQNVEKDFWVCWTLDALFNSQTAKSPRLLFKGGTSLSKGYGLIERFSEDIDITVFREDIGQAASVRSWKVSAERSALRGSTPSVQRARNTSAGLF